MIHLDAATVLLQWAVGGLAFLWFTTRRHEISLGYSMLLRITYGVFAAGACGFGLPEKCSLRGTPLPEP